MEKGSSPLSLTFPACCFCYYCNMCLLLLRLATWAVARPTTAFLPFPLLPPPCTHTPLSRSFPISSHPQSHPSSLTFCHSRAHGHVTTAGLHRAALLCKASSSPALLVICDPPQQPTANTQ